MKLSEIVAQIYDRIEAGPLHPVWISLVPRQAALARAQELESSPPGPLLGTTFAVKDNLDVTGLPTTAGCPAYAYTPARSAPAVQRLQDAGAILIGKTNMDQFATGLVGTRSPHGSCSSVFDERYISGGSSSGSAVAVARGLVTFALGTDTAGSGRVPAAFNGIIGLKPTRGLLSTSGVVPACRSLDCVSIFAANCHEAHRVWKAARGFDASDPYSRALRPGDDAAPWLEGPFRFGVPPSAQLQFFGDEEAQELFAAAVEKVERLRGEKVEIDFSPFRAAADLLYQGPWVAERLAAIERFIREHAAEMNAVVRGIIAGGERYSAVDAFSAQYKLNELCQATAKEWARMDVLVLPTTGTIYTHEQVAADPVGKNTNLGYYTNFVNLMDLAAAAIPAGFRSNGLPFGISFIGRAFSDEALLHLAHRYFGANQPLLPRAPGCVDLAVVGAHLTGQPLNWQLTQRGARLKKTCRTASRYRLYALEGTTPAKPGLILDTGAQGLGIEVEVWTMPEGQFGGFLAEIPPPLAIGSITLESGESVKGFLCEAWAIAGATEITRFGGWRAYRTSSKL
ncbi:MAG TPA: allophanate hydrolase [Candidatus Acidoferrales bacterium]|nr:allophanate hydrolase [Candidatus Acidoferrales bacterium]